MKIKEKMVELKAKSINFVKEHKYDIMVIGLYTAVDLAFYCVGRRDGRIERDRDWQKELDGKVVIGDDMVNLYKDKLDISNEQVTHMMIITDPETGK